MTRGACVVYPGPAFSPTSVLEAVQNHKATSLYGVPTMFIDELTSPHFSKYDLSTLRTGLMAGSPCPTDVLEQVKLRMHMKDIGVAYGMTETSPVSTQTRSGTSTALQVSTVGQVHPHVEIKIISESNEMVSIGHVGEFCTRRVQRDARLLERQGCNICCNRRKPLAAYWRLSKKWIPTGSFKL